SFYGKVFFEIADDEERLAPAEGEFWGLLRFSGHELVPAERRTQNAERRMKKMLPFSILRSAFCVLRSSPSLRIRHVPMQIAPCRLRRSHLHQRRLASV